MDLPTGHKFTGEVNRVVSHPPGFTSHCGLSHPNGTSQKETKEGANLKMILVEQLPLKPGMKAEESSSCAVQAPNLGVCFLKQHPNRRNNR